MELEPVRIEVVVLGGDGGEDDGKGDSGGEGEGVGVDIRNEGKVVAVAIWRWYRGVDDEDELGWTDFALRHGWTSKFDTPYPSPQDFSENKHATSEQTDLDLLFYFPLPLLLFSLLTYTPKGAGCAHRDLNVTRALAMAAKFSTKKEKYVDAVFGRDQLYLELLGTHPDYQGKGAGSQLVKAGLERGTEAGENITLIAHPTAETFYLGLGFREHRNFSVGALEGSERFGYNVLVYEGGVGNASVAA